MTNIIVMILGYFLVGFLTVVGSDPNPEDSKNQRRILFFIIWLLWPYVFIRTTFDLLEMFIHFIWWNLKRWFR